MAFTIGTSQSRLFIGYANKVRPEHITTIAQTGGTVEAGSNISNLKYEDVSRRLRLTSVASTCLITITFSSAQTFTCFGIQGHDMKTAAYTGSLQFLSGSYQTIDTWSPSSDADTLFRFPSQQATSWRVGLIGTGPVQVSNLFFGTVYEPPVNVVQRGYSTRYEAPVTFENRLGSAQIVTQRAGRLRRVSNLVFEMAPSAMRSSILQAVLEAYATPQTPKRLLGIVPPNQVKQVLPITEHFFGYPINWDERLFIGDFADLLVSLEGA